MSTHENDDNGSSPTPASNGKTINGKDICRDYLNKICNRGTRCKFYHPPSEDGQEQRRDDFSFCIDYQNQGCYRENCRFVHAPGQDVEEYKKTGDVSNILARAVAAVTKQDNINGIPFCKEFQSGRCTRGQRCRYWHINLEAERERRRSLIASGGAGIDPALAGGNSRQNFQLRPQPIIGSRRRPADAPPGGDYLPPKRGYDALPGGYGAPPIQTSDPYVMQLERDNADLRRELDAARRDAQRERDRYDSLMAVFNSTAHQQPQPSAYAQAPVAPAQPTYQQQSSYAQAPVVNPVPPPQQQIHPQQQKWGGVINNPEWFQGN